jgi:hypothetical protein
MAEGEAMLINAGLASEVVSIMNKDKDDYDIAMDIYNLITKYNKTFTGTKIGLPENRKRLQSAGVEKAKNSSFDEGYNAGFKAGIDYTERIADEKIKS